MVDTERYAFVYDDDLMLATDSVASISLAYFYIITYVNNYLS